MKNISTSAVLTIVALIFAVTLGLGFLGRAVTPNPARLLTYEDWTAMKMERAYEAELASLRAAGAELAATLDAPPDPIQGGLLHARLAQAHASGLDTLAEKRSALLTANNAVYAWVTAQSSRAEAANAVQAALERLR